MSASLALIAVLPNALQYRWYYDGVGDSMVQRLQAQLIADCVRVGCNPTQLQLQLQDATTDAAWEALKLATWTSRNVLGPRKALALQVAVFDEGRGLQVRGFDGIAGAAVLEIRL